MRRLLNALLLCALLAPALARAAETGSAAAPPPPPPPPATVRFFNRDIVTLRGYYFGLPPADRAAQSVQRIRDVVARGGPGTIRTVRTTEGMSFILDGTFVFRMVDADLDAEDGQTYEQAQAVVGKRLTDAIAAARSSMRSRELLRAVVLSVVATLGLGVAVWLLSRMRAWLRRRLEGTLTRRLRLGEQEWTMLVRVVRTAGHFIFLAIGVALVEEWLRFVFGLYPYTQPWSEELTGWAVTIAGRVGNAIVASAPGLVMVAVIASLAHLVTRILKVIALGIKAGRYRLLGIDAHTIALARRLANTIVWLFALAMAYPYLPGSSSEAFKGLSVLVGVMLSLGASGVVGQAAGGFILTFSHLLRPGEWVRVGDVEGAVVTVGMFSTRIRTATDEEVAVPNNVVLGSITRNFSRPAAAEASILETSVTIGYNAPWRQVHAMLLDAAARTAEIERVPPPEVLQTSLSDFYVQYSLRVRILDQPRRPFVLSALNANIQDVFNEYGVQIMSPHYAFDAAAPVLVPKEKWFEPPAAGSR